MTDNRICNCCGVDMNEWDRKDSDGVVTCWEIIKLDPVTHLHWECDPCHTALDAWAANGGSKQCHSQSVG